MKQKIVLAATLSILAQVAFAKGVQAHDAYAREVVAGVQQSGAFVTLKNTDAKDNVLVGASVSKKIAAYTELHTHINENGVMKMREVKDGIPLPAGETVALKPGSYHIMFFGLKKGLTAGKKISITLKFKDGQRKRVIATVKSLSKPSHTQTTETESTHQHHHHH